MADIGPEWIAASALFTEENVQYKVMIEDFNFLENNEPLRVPQNVYSMNYIKKLFHDRGYTKFEFLRYDIDIDIPIVDANKRGTYTVKCGDGKRLQISANFLMPWYFIFAGR